MFVGECWLLWFASLFRLDNGVTYNECLVALHLRRLPCMQLHTTFVLGFALYRTVSGVMAGVVPLIVPGWGKAWMCASVVDGHKDLQVCCPCSKRMPLVCCVGGV
jgi:hypothetical protein